MARPPFDAGQRPVTDEEIAEPQATTSEQREETLDTLAEDLDGDSEDYRDSSENEQAD